VEKKPSLHPVSKFESNGVFILIPDLKKKKRKIITARTSELSIIKSLSNSSSIDNCESKANNTDVMKLGVRS
jgi:hypothetical protein